MYHDRRAFPCPDGPKRLWVDVPPHEWATAEHCLERIARRDAAEGRVSYPFRDGLAHVAHWLKERQRHFDNLVALHDGCAAAVDPTLMGLWKPCYRRAINGRGLCHSHGGWRSGMGVRARNPITVNLDEDDCKPVAEVNLTIKGLTLGDLTRQLGKIKRAAEGMGAPPDAALTINTYSEETQVRVKWRP